MKVTTERLQETHVEEKVKFLLFCCFKVEDEAEAAAASALGAKQQNTQKYTQLDPVNCKQ